MKESQIQIKHLRKLSNRNRKQQHFKTKDDENVLPDIKLSENTNISSILLTKEKTNKDMLKKKDIPEIVIKTDKESDQEGSNMNNDKGKGTLMKNTACSVLKYNVKGQYCICIRQL